MGTVNSPFSTLAAGDAATLIWNRLGFSWLLAFPQALFPPPSPLYWLFLQAKIASDRRPSSCFFVLIRASSLIK